MILSKFIPFSLLLLVGLFVNSCDKQGSENNLGLTDKELNVRLTTSIVGQSPDGAGNLDNVCAGGTVQLMSDDPFCGYVDIGEHCVNEINYYRALEGLPPFARAHEHEACAAREARLAVEAGKAHFSDGCGWKSQGSTGGGRGGNNSTGTVKGSVSWAPKLFYQEGPNGGHYQAMMTERSRYVSCGYYALDRDDHRIIINYYDEL